MRARGGLPNGRRARVQTLAAVAASVWLLVGCGIGNAPPAPTIVEQATGIGLYPVCGVSTLNYEGTKYYSLVGERFQALDTSVYPSAPPLVEDSALPAGSGGMGGGRGGVGMAAPPPGPGDATGTLVIYSDGYAHWTSDNGKLDAWLFTEEYEYLMIC